SVVAVAIGASLLYGGTAAVVPQVPIHPRLQELHGVEPGQAPYRVVNLAGRGPSLRATEEVGGEEQELAVRLDSAADRSPEAIHQDARHPSHARALHADLGLAIVEEEVPRLVEDDALEKIREHRVITDRRE